MTEYTYRWFNSNSYYREHKGIYSINIIDTIKTAVKKTLNISAFKIYPNPAIKGNTMHLEIKQCRRIPIAVTR